MKNNICFFLGSLLGGLSSTLSMGSQIAEIIKERKQRKMDSLAEATEAGNNLINQVSNAGDMNYSFGSDEDLMNAFSNNAFTDIKNEISGNTFDSEYNDSLSAYNSKKETAMKLADNLSKMDNEAKLNAANKYNNMKNRILPTVYEFGGDTQTNGMTVDTGLTELDGGYKHGQGAYDGIPIGMSPDGELNVAERGEAIYEDYVFSDSIIVTKQAVEKYGFPKKFEGKTIAECAKLAAKEFKERGGTDNISKNTMQSELKKLRAYNDEKLAEMQLLEQLKQLRNTRMDIAQEEAARQHLMAQKQAEQQAAMQQQQMNQIPQEQVPMENPGIVQSKCGGGINRFKLGSIRNRAERITGIDLPDDWARKDYRSAINQYKQSDDYKNTMSSRWQKTGVGLNALGSIVGDIIGLATTRKPDYTEAEKIRNSVKKPDYVTAEKAKFIAPEVYIPRYTNIDYFSNQAQNALITQLNAFKEGLLTPGQYLTAAATAAQQYNNTLGDFMLKGYERNDAERAKELESYNNMIKTLNDQESLNVAATNKARELNASLDNAFNSQNMQANVYAANMINTLDTSYSDALSSGITGMVEGIGNFGKLLWDAKTARTPNYSGIDQSVVSGKFGGVAKRRKRNKK